MTFYNEHEEEPTCPPREHVLGDRTEFKGKPYTPPAPKPKVNYEEAFKLEGDTFRRKVNDPRFEDVEPPQVKGETAKPPFWMKWEMPKVEKKETVKAHPWMK